MANLQNSFYIPNQNTNIKAQTPLWESSTKKSTKYKIYSISNRHDSVGSASKTCLSCHDGLISSNTPINAIGAGAYNAYSIKKIKTTRAFIINNPNKSGMGNHPIGVVYDPQKSLLKPLNTVLSNWGDKRTIASLLKKPYNTVECTSCHDPNSSNEKFLRSTTRDSNLCLTCHNK